MISKIGRRGERLDPDAEGMGRSGGSSGDGAVQGGEVGGPLHD